MPRVSRTKEVVIPTTSLVASAVRYDGKTTRIYQPNRDWQREAYRHYAICGEARFAAKFFGQALSRATLKMTTKTATGYTDQKGGKAVVLFSELFNGADGQAQMLEALGVHLTIAGECYLVGRTVEGMGDVWEIVSILEIQVSGSKWTINYGDGQPPVELKDSDVVIRIWQPDPAKRIEADSPFRSLLPILTEIEWLTRHVFAQVSSRLAGAGILFLPQGMTFPPPPEQEGGGTPQTANDAEAFMLTLADGMLTPISDPSSAAAMVPIVVTAPDDSIDKAKLMHFWSNLDEASLEMRQEAIRRFALGMDLPPEQVTGMSSSADAGGGRAGVSHWGAWQIEESTIKFHIEPMLELICNALTIGYIRPLTKNVNDVVRYDTASLRLRPDRSRESFELFDRGLISLDTLLQENGFDPQKVKMDDAEFQQWLLRKVASGSATPEMVNAALEQLGLDLGVEVATSNSNLNESRPTPTLEDHPTRPRTPGESGPPPALVAASEALVFRALERAGNRIRQKAGIKPPGVKSYEMHTLHLCNGSAEVFLEDAWSCAPQVLEGIAPVETTVQTLNAYCLSLMAQQVPHTRERLTLWLGATR